MSIHNTLVKNTFAIKDVVEKLTEGLVQVATSETPRPENCYEAEEVEHTYVLLVVAKSGPLDKKDVAVNTRLATKALENLEEPVYVKRFGRQDALFAWKPTSRAWHLEPCAEEQQKVEPVFVHTLELETRYNEPSVHQTVYDRVVHLVHYFFNRYHDAVNGTRLQWFLYKK